MLDAARFPRLARYLDLLPEGIDSYPTCQSKGVLFRSAIEGHDLSPALDGLPLALRDLIETPPPAGVWMSAVLCDAAFHAVCDRFYPTDAAIEAWSESRTRSTAKSRAYQRIVGVAGPGVFLRLAETLHNKMFQRGTVVRIQLDGNSASFRLSHPPYLHLPSKHGTNVPMLRALLEQVGGRDIEVEMQKSDPEGAVYAARWG